MKPGVTSRNVKTNSETANEGRLDRPKPLSDWKSREIGWPKVKWDDLMAIDSIGHLDTTIAVEHLL
jgi:hypothetical protein